MPSTVKVVSMPAACRSPRILRLLPPLAFGIAWAIGCAWTEPVSGSDAELRRSVHAILARPRFKQSSFGILIAHVSTGEVLYELNADKLFPPASTAKLISGAGALGILGKDYRFETRVVTSATLRRTALEGDLILVASGDPNLSQRVNRDGRLIFRNQDHSYAGFFDAESVPGDPLQLVHRLAQQVRDTGVRTIEGNVVVDDGLFVDTTDEFVANLSAICINDNLVDVFVSPGAEPGQTASIRVQPVSRVINVRCAAKTTPQGGKTRLWLESREGVGEFVLRGSIAKDSEPVLRVAPVRRPAILAARYLIEALRQQGINVRGKAVRARFGPTIYASYRTLASYSSPPLSEAVKVALKVSQNLHATMLPLVIGAEKGKRGTRLEGYRVLREHFIARGVPVDDIVIASGSGGGRPDRISPEWMVSFLRHMSKRDEFPAFFEALPVSGVDGTLAKSFESSSVRKRVHAKTGTLVFRGALNRHWIYTAKSLAGYLDLRGQRRPNALWAFVIAIANTPAENRLRGARELMRAQEDLLRVFVHAIEARGGVGAAK